MFSTVGVGDGAAEDGDGGGGMVVADLLGVHVTSSRVISSGFEMMFVDGVSSTTLLGNTERGGERDRPGEAPRRSQHSQGEPSRPAPGPSPSRR